MNPSPAIQCEIAFIAGQSRHQARLWIQEKDIQTLSEMADAVDVEIAQARVDIQGFSFLHQVGTSSERLGSAMELVEILENETGSDEGVKWKQLRRLAEAVDKKGLQPTEPATMVEFVWENGGGDGNLFTQGFDGSLSSKEGMAFTAALESLESAGLVYDLAIYEDVPDPTAYESVQELLTWVEGVEKEMPCLGGFLRSAKSMELQERLENVLPAAPTSKGMRL